MEEIDNFIQFCEWPEIKKLATFGIARTAFAIDFCAQFIIECCRQIFEIFDELLVSFIKDD